jgi:hypothetical protein
MTNGGSALTRLLFPVSCFLLISSLRPRDALPDEPARRTRSVSRSSDIATEVSWKLARQVRLPGRPLAFIFRGSGRYPALRSRIVASNQNA